MASRHISWIALLLVPWCFCEAEATAFMDAALHQDEHLQRVQALGAASRLLLAHSGSHHANYEAGGARHAMAIWETALDASVPEELSFLDEVKASTDPAELFWVSIFQSDLRTWTIRGRRRTLEHGPQLILDKELPPGDPRCGVPRAAIIVPTPHQVGSTAPRVPKSRLDDVVAARFDPVSHLVLGYFLGSCWPTTGPTLVQSHQDSRLLRRIDAIPSVIPGWQDNGVPAQYYVEFSRAFFARNLYFHTRSDDEITIWTGPPGRRIELTDTSRWRPASARKTLDTSVRVSLLAGSGVLNAAGLEIAAVPRDLGAGDIRHVLGAMPSLREAELMLVDARGESLSSLTSAWLTNWRGRRVALLAPSLWSAAIQREPLSTPAVEKIAMTSVIDQIFDEQTTCSLPPGLDVLLREEGDYDAIGLTIKRPDRIPVARLIAPLVTWDLFDGLELNKLISLRTVPSDMRLQREYAYSQGSVRLPPYEPEPGRPKALIVVNNDDDLIEVVVGANWTNPVLDERFEDAWAMTVDPSTGVPEFHSEAIPGVGIGTVDLTRGPEVLEPRLEEVSDEPLFEASRHR